MSASVEKIVDDVLVAGGWYLHSTCHCGSFRQTYRNRLIPEYEIKVYYANMVFRIFKINKTVLGPTNIENLHEQVSKILQDANQEEKHKNNVNH